MELEFRHLSLYFPYGLNLQFIIRGVVERTGKMTNVSHDLEMTPPTKIGLDYYDSEHIWMYKPILRPLSDLEDNLDWLSQMAEDVNHFLSFHNAMFSDAMTNEFTIEWIPQVCFEWLVKNHFDVFGLIPAGLAISYKEVGL